ncbi:MULTISPECIES: hypothetical protein [unclassified Sphingobium]|uniref:hypothetical protein n=1 Tax=unclassified Sphingobium TaxID=2611147 RepID=UPI001D02081F|nr:MULTISPECIES: hypothetical protein [unclassified Sphingobium]MCB4860773.1 hypothetical protein [Sphingobium sp. PNB]WDA36416.1 hypothetical protein PO876_23805 [Sphingobium sp. YC-XJ3]
MEQDHDQFRKPQTAEEWAEQKRQQNQLLKNSLLQEISELEAKLEPRSLEEIMVALSRCLTLTAPTGMSQEDRDEWLMVAAPELADLPSMLFDDACAHARRTADHPAKIIPSILKYEPSSYWLGPAHARQRLSDARARLANLNAPRLQQTVDENEKHEVGSGMKDLLRDLMKNAEANL